MSPWSGMIEIPKSRKTWFCLRTGQCSTVVALRLDGLKSWKIDRAEPCSTAVALGLPDLKSTKGSLYRWLICGGVRRLLSLLTRCVIPPHNQSVHLREPSWPRPCCREGREEEEEDGEDA